MLVAQEGNVEEVLRAQPPAQRASALEERQPRVAQQALLEHLAQIVVAVLSGVRVRHCASTRGVVCVFLQRLQADA